MRTAKAQVHPPSQCSFTHYRELEEVSDKEPEIWPHWIAVYVHLKDLEIWFLVKQLKYFLASYFHLLSLKPSISWLGQSCAGL